jgi:hypothetical protein
MASTSRLALGGWSLLVALSAAATVQAPSEQALSTVARGLESARSTDQLDDTWQAADAYRRSFTGDLLDLFLSTPSREVKARACYLLGSFRASEFSHLIADEIDLESGADDLAAGGRYPCGEALFTIGKPAEPAVLSFLAKTDSDVKRHLALQLLLALRGKCGAEDLIRQRLQGAPEPHSLRMQKALDELESGAFEKRVDFPRGTPHPAASTKRSAEGAGSAAGLDRAMTLLQHPRSHQDLDDAVAWAEQRRHEVAATLIDLLRRTSSDQVKARACYLLSTLGATEAIPTLIQNIRVPPTVDEFRKIPAWGVWPCEQALTDLGQPAKIPLLDLLAQSDDAGRRDSAMDVLLGLRGRCGAAELIRNALAGESGPRAARLRQALASVEHPVVP